MLELGKATAGTLVKETKVDITLEFQDECGESLVLNGINFTEWVRVKMVQFPALRSLFYLLKQLLHHHNLHVPYQGTHSAQL